MFYPFIGEFAMYQVFAQMKHNLNFDAFDLIKYPIQHPKLITHWKKLRSSAFQWYKGLGVVDRVFSIKYASAQKS
jgi:hypothetical protein